MTRQRPTRRPAASSAGFTLMEVILALLVLGMSAAVLGEIMRLSNRHSVDARGETQAQILAQSVLDEIVSGYIDAVDTRDEAIESDDGTRWLYSVTMGQSVLEGILPVEVTVQQDIEERLSPVEFRLLQWLPSIEEVPEEDEAAEEDQEEAQAEGAASGSAAGGRGGGA